MDEDVHQATALKAEAAPVAVPVKAPIILQILHFSTEPIGAPTGMDLAFV